MDYNQVVVLRIAAAAGDARIMEVPWTRIMEVGLCWRIMEVGLCWRTGVVAYLWSRRRVVDQIRGWRIGEVGVSHWNRRIVDEEACLHQTVVEDRPSTLMVDPTFGAATKVVVASIANAFNVADAFTADQMVLEVVHLSSWLECLQLILAFTSALLVGH